MMAAVVIDLDDGLDLKPNPPMPTIAPQSPLTAVTNPTVGNKRRRHGKDDPPQNHIKIFDFQQHIRVMAPDCDEPFVIHKDFAHYRSPYFKTAHDQHPGELMTFEQPDWSVWSRYIQVLYFGIVHIEKHEYHYTVEDLFDLYMLAEKLGDLQSMNTIIDATIEWFAESPPLYRLPSLQDIGHVFTKSAADSRLKRWLIDYYLHEACEQDMADADNVAADGLEDFWVEVAKEFVKLKMGRPRGRVSDVFGSKPSERLKCHYHQHSEEFPPCTSA
ncbi:hypothetical protein LTR22_001230 [Elasticomyces elasticus]|nr:hypothetical protein LTR22_001230 [Elasticomyces elasticus]KAK4932222.1 hypothetical protein LTR49_001519 [Elasticomyces elasticus]KAK5763398.1 hypothetical protein LTS12_006369 [Elasticomyces elasticus]